MPELPEVETVVQGLQPHLKNQKIKSVLVHINKLRYPLDNLNHLASQPILNIKRRSKYIIFEFKHGNLLAHLGMSGIFRLYDQPAPQRLKHDHIEFDFDNFILRYHDPRRFGSIIWTEKPIDNHPLIKSLGPEPLSDEFSHQYFYKILQKSKRPIKLFIMDSQNVCGVGNIYANEALFKSHIHPQRQANTLSDNETKLLLNSIRMILTNAIKQGGTTLKDFKNSSGKPGYFAQQLLVYGKKDKPCPKCQSPIKKITLGQRGTFYCPSCQTL